MATYLVTGRAGSGKTAVADELKNRGFLAFDSDSIPGLSGWYSRETGELVNVADTSYVDLQTLQWLWDIQKVNELFQTYQSFFLCGGAENDLDFTQSFDGSFVLDVEPQIQTRRLANRTNNNYGKDARMLKHILAMQQRHLTEASKLGAIIVDANQPITIVVDKILAYCHDK